MPLWDNINFTFGKANTPLRDMSPGRLTSSSNPVSTAPRILWISTGYTLRLTYSGYCSTMTTSPGLVQRLD
ncbi:hypothetical protein JG688_00014658 [Phytophthora aleatoria]|uniref:Uncharacterized protein n=1 Tax=Phytophthora aleatoria TaxID=2496075 RepID=A0A8J5M360_9STRA|nr:hypothetical protein JG688_00014658 [Phytophthora aleatoria]